MPTIQPNRKDINVIILFNTAKVGIEPTTGRLTADCSTAELLGTKERVFVPETEGVPT